MRGLTYAATVWPCRYNAVADNEEVPKLWMPPESLQKRIYSRASDVWAFGVTLWEIVTDANIPYFMWACGDEELVKRSLRLATCGV